MLRVAFTRERNGSYECSVSGRHGLELNIQFDLLIGSPITSPVPFLTTRAEAIPTHPSSPSAPQENDCHKVIHQMGSDTDGQISRSVVSVCQRQPNDEGGQHHCWLNVKGSKNAR